MASIGTYKRNQEDENGVINDSVEIQIEADNDQERIACFNDVMVIHSILEECGILKKTPDKNCR